jgi:signal peptidase II
MSAEPQDPAAAAAPAGPRNRALWAYALAVAVIVLDQLTKYWIVQILHFGPGSSLTVFGPLRLTFVYNQGISFGLLQADGAGRWLLAGFSAAAAVLLAIWATRTAKPWLSVGIGLVMGGAVGNLIDRATTGRVVDFVDVTALMFPWVFNVADAAISIGFVLLFIDAFWPERKTTA